MYRDFLVEGLTNLGRVEKGDEFEEDHQRGHHMTVNFLIEKGAVKQVSEGGRTYWVVEDYAKMREAVGELLSKLMVIKATGDYEGIRELVTQKGIKFDPKLRDEVAAAREGRGCAGGALHHRAAPGARARRQRAGDGPPGGHHPGLPRPAPGAQRAGPAVRPPRPPAPPRCWLANKPEVFKELFKTLVVKAPGKAAPAR